MYLYIGTNEVSKHILLLVKALILFPEIVTFDWSF